MIYTIRECNGRLQINFERHPVILSIAGEILDRISRIMQQVDPRIKYSLALNRNNNWEYVSIDFIIDSSTPLTIIVNMMHRSFENITYNGVYG